MTFLAWTHGWKYLMAAATAAEAASLFPSSAAAAGERRVEYEASPKAKQTAKRRKHGLSLEKKKKKRDWLSPSHPDIVAIQGDHGPSFVDTFVMVGGLLL